VGNRDPFNVGKSSGSSKSKKKHGLIAALGHIASQTGRDLYHSAVDLPAGLAKVGEDFGKEAERQATGYYVKHPTAKHPIVEDLKGMATGTYHDLRHPLRHPGFSALDLLAIGSLGAGAAERVAAAGRVARAGEGAGAAVKALARVPEPAPRVLRAHGVEVRVPSSRRPLTRVAQRAADRVIAEKAPGLHTRRVGKQLRHEERIVGGVERGPASGLIAVGKRLNRDRQTALRVVSEGVPIDERIAVHTRDLQRASGRTARRLRMKIGLLERARKYVDESSGRPRIAASHSDLQGVYERVRKVAKGREALLARVGELTPDAIEERLHSPGRIFKGAKFEAPTPGKLGKPSQALIRARAYEQRLGTLVDRAENRAISKASTEELLGPVFGGKELGGPTLKRLRSAHSVARDEVQRLEASAAGRVKPTGLVGGEGFRGGEVYVPHRPDSGIRGSLRRSPQVGANETVAQPQLRPGTGQPLTGAAIHSGSFGDVTTELVGRSALEAHKFGALLRLRERIRPAVKAIPESKHDILVRLDELSRTGPLPGIARELRDKLELGARLTADEQRQVAGKLDELRGRLFPSTRSEPLAPEALHELQQLHVDGKIGYVDRRLLGGLDKPQLRLEQFTGQRAAKAFDAVNNASRAAILYLKPAYAVPNLLGNAALNVLQQGFAAVPNLGRALKLSRSLGPDLAAHVDEVMGEGFSQALAGESGIGTRAIQAAANFWGKGVDVPFRRSSFLHEAAKAGYQTPADLRRLLTDASARGDLVQVARRANRAIIDYANLSPIERAVIARTIFFYPWVKGSTAYAAHFVTEHPLEAAIAAHVGELGYEESQRQLGDLPSYLEGLIPVGHAKSGNPLVINPSSAAVFQTPAQVGAALAGLFEGHPNKVAALTNFPTPAVTLLTELLTRQTDTGVPIKGGAPGVAYDALIRNLPQVTLARNLIQGSRGEGKQRIYPPDVRSALLQYLLGGVGTPRELNLGAARRAAESERRR
jgi:hypothetical protein